MEKPTQFFEIKNLVLPQTIAPEQKLLVEGLFLEFAEIQEYAIKVLRVRLNRDMWWRPMEMKEFPNVCPILFAAFIVYAMTLENRIEQLVGTSVDGLCCEISGEFDLVCFKEDLGTRLKKLDVFIASDKYKTIHHLQQSMLKQQYYAMRVIFDRLQ